MQVNPRLKAYDMAAWAYRPYEWDGTMVHGFVHKSIISGNTEVLAAANDEWVFIAFAGTHFRSKEDRRDDFRAKSTTLSESFSARIRVHSGYKSHTNRVWGDLWSYLSLHAGKKIVLSGHSLGGAAATIAAAKLGLGGVFTEELHTYGAPPVGNPCFVSLVERSVQKIRRNVNNSDVVTRLGWPFYRHAGDLIYISSQGRRHVSPGNLFVFCDRVRGRVDRVRMALKELWGAATDGFQDHSLVNYREPTRIDG